MSNATDETSIIPAIDLTRVTHDPKDARKVNTLRFLVNRGPKVDASPDKVTITRRQSDWRILIDVKVNGVYYAQGCPVDADTAARWDDIRRRVDQSRRMANNRTMEAACAAVLLWK